MYNIFPWLTEHLPGRQHKAFGHIKVVRSFIKEKIQQHQDSLVPTAPRDFIDCFLNRIQQVGNNTPSHCEDRMQQLCLSLNWFQDFTDDF